MQTHRGQFCHAFYSRCSLDVVQLSALHRDPECAREEVIDVQYLDKEATPNDVSLDLCAAHHEQPL